jgi:homocysteine S-methyltransferase
MVKPRFLTLLEESKVPILGDGAMGTMLNVRGAGFEQCFDALNLTNPALVAGIHRDYIQAGSQVIQTNTFGANRFKLAEHGLEDKVAEINRAGVELARRVVLASFKDVLVAGDVGPLGVRLAPFGRVQPEQGRQAFAEQIAALADAGVDLLIIETISDLVEVREAVAAARAVSELPVVASMTFTRDDRTLLGDSPAKVAETLRSGGRRDRGELLRRAGSDLADPAPDAPGDSRSSFLGHAERGMARTGGWAHHVPGEPGLFRRVRARVL